jgi:hypothetical protein
MAPRARFELATLRLTAECSTIELPGNGQARLLIYNNLQTRATLLSLKLGPTWVQQRFQLSHFRRVMLPQQLRIVVDHLV